MSEDHTPQNLPAVQREKAIVADTIPVFDTNRFEHYGRIATVLADSSLVPDTLKDRGDRKVSIANCFQVVELADRFGYSPFAVAQCASVVHGKLMLEGKLVSAVLSTKLGVKLHHYYIGEWGTPDYRIFVTDRELDESEVLELTPHKKIHGVRMVDGSVKEWQTFEKNSTNPKGNWKNQPDMQLLYRGDRTWARAYESAVMLGVYADDEMDELQERRLEVVSSQPSLTAGFTGEKPARAPRTPKEAPAATEPADKAAEGAAAGAQGAGDGEEVHDADFTDANQSGGEGEQGGAEPSTATGSSETTDEQQPTDSTDSSTGTSSTDEPTGSASSSADETVTQTVAPAGVVYCIASDEPDDAGRVPTYKDGVGFSRVKVDSKSKPAAFHLHPPAADDDASEEGEKIDTASDDGEKQEVAGDEAPNPFLEAMAKIDTSPTYLAGKQVARTLSETDAWKAADKGVKDRLRQQLWNLYVQLRDEGKEMIAVYEEVVLMQLFIQFGETTENELDNLWGRFYRGAYKTAAEHLKNETAQMLVERKKLLKAPAQ